MRRWCLPRWTPSFCIASCVLLPFASGAARRVDGFRRELDALIDEMGLLVEAAREQAAQAQAAAA